MAGLGVSRLGYIRDRRLLRRESSGLIRVAIAPMHIGDRQPEICSLEKISCEESGSPLPDAAADPFEHREQSSDQNLPSSCRF